MRWLFADMGNQLEVQKKRQVDADIDLFWQQFKVDQAALLKSARQADGGNLFNWMGSHLHKIHPGLLWEIEVDEGGKKAVFVITAGGSHELRLLVEAVLHAAPSLDNWLFSSYKAANDLTMVRDSRIPGDWTDTEVFLERNKSNSVDLTFVSDKFESDNIKSDFLKAIVLAETVLGEEILDKWVGNIYTRAKRDTRLKTIMRVVRPDVLKMTKTKIVDLPKSVETIIGQIKDELPNKPLWQFDSQTFTVDTVSPDESDEKTPSRLTTVTIVPNISLSVQSRVSFHSCAFSKFGEIYCYIKIIDADSPLDNPAKYSEFELYLDQKLRQAKIGCATGSGVGVDAAYIDLMLADVRAAIPVLQKASKKFKLPEKSWLLFHDLYWKDEWVGMTEHSPLPLREEGQW